MGQPIRLFGESDKQCKVRLRALELMDEKSGVSISYILEEEPKKKAYF
jgi:hypothetical protein